MYLKFISSSCCMLLTIYLLFDFIFNLQVRFSEVTELSILLMRYISATVVEHFENTQKRFCTLNVSCVCQTSVNYMCLFRCLQIKMAKNMPCRVLCSSIKLTAKESKLMAERIKKNYYVHL